MYANKCGNKKPTMVLDLTDEFIAVTKTKNQYRRSLVIHEFGHALGLEHEHQRSELWQVLSKYIDKNAMNDSDRVSTKKSKDGVRLDIWHGLDKEGFQGRFHLVKI